CLSICSYILSFCSLFFPFFFFNDTTTTEIYTLSLHDALPISRSRNTRSSTPRSTATTSSTTVTSTSVSRWAARAGWSFRFCATRSEEHTSELQSRGHLVCRLLLEKKKKKQHIIDHPRVLYA